jgi:hypothetical protein
MRKQELEKRARIMDSYALGEKIFAESLQITKFRVNQKTVLDLVKWINMDIANGWGFQGKDPCEKTAHYGPRPL